MEKAEHSNIGIYWQPQLGLTIDQNIVGLESFLPRLVNIHVFQWTGTIENIHRHPLSEGKDYWTKYFEIVKQKGIDSIALLEFVKGDSPDQFLKDAAILVNLLDKE